MALTKAQISQVTVAALGVAPGGYQAQLSAYNTQDELAAFLESANLLGANQTNAEFAAAVKENVGGAGVSELYEALEAGTSRAEAVVDFAGQLIVDGNAAFDTKVKAAVASNSTSTDLAELKAVVAPAADDAMKVTFTDSEQDQTGTNPNNTDQDIYNVGKAQLDAGQSKVSADYTFELKNQIGEDDTFDGLFLSPILERQAAESSGSQLFLELLDLRAAEDGKDPLQRVPVDTFAFTLDGSQILVQSDAIFNANTYAELFAAIDARITELGNGVNVPATNSDGSPADAAAYAKLAGFTVELGNQFTVTNQSGDEVSGTQIVLTDAGGATLAPAGFLNKEGVIPDPGYTLYAQLDNVPPTTITKLITTNLEADNVGYGSQGASVNLAGQSASDKGVEEIKVTATNGVWFTKLQSKAATDHLERVELQTGSNSYFRVGTQKNNPNHVVDLADQDFSKGGLKDVQELDAKAAESAAVNSFVSDAILSRFEQDDTGIYTADDTQATVDYDLTSGNDVLNLAIDTDILESVDAQVDVAAGAGNDVITVMATDGLTANKAVALEQTGATNGWVINQQLLDNVKIDAGAGNDWVMTTGAGAAIINAGAGDDVVRVDNAGDRGVFVFNNATTDITTLSNNRDIVSNSDDALTNNANGTAQTYDFFKAQVQVTFKGFESAFVEIDSTDYRTTTEQINQAIKKAVNTDAVLSKLLYAVDNEGNALAIESLIDGLLQTDELSIDIIEPVAYDANETDAAKAAREDAGQLMLAQDDLTKAAEAYDQAAGTVTVGAGNTINSAVTAAETLYASEFGTNNTTATVATTTAGAFEVQNFDLAAVSVANGEALTFTIDGSPVVYNNTSGGALTGAALAADIAGNLAPAAVNGATYTATQSGATSTLVITQSVLSKNIADITAVNQTPASGTIGAPATGSVNGANEVQTLDLSNVTVADTQTLTFTSAALTGGAITYTNSTGADISGAALAAAVQNAIDTAGNNESATVSGNVVTVTYDGQQAGAAGDVAEIVVTGTGAGSAVNYAGSASGAESDNIVNLGSGQDVLTLGTGGLSNDIVKVESYNLGEKSIVNFTIGAPSNNNDADLLDFSSYLANVDANGARIASTVDTGSLTTDNAVTLVEFNEAAAKQLAGNIVTFESLTAANVKAMINGTVDANNVFGNLDINIAASGASTETDNYVLMVHDNVLGGTANNEGTYKAFHVTSKGDSADAADVKLIGTFDFGADAAGDSNLDGLVAANLV